MNKINYDPRMQVVDGLTPLGKGVTLLERLSRTDLGPLLVLLSLFIISFCLFAGGMILMVSGWSPVLGAIFLIVKIGRITKSRKRRICTAQKRDSKCSMWKGMAKWMVILGWWLPHEHRDAIMGDILEDCHEMIESGLSKRQIRTHVLWQWMIAVVTLFPSFVVRAVIRLWRIP